MTLIVSCFQTHEVVLTGQEGTDQAASLLVTATARAPTSFEAPGGLDQVPMSAASSW